MQNVQKLSGATALITGASRGIGKCIALKLARDGANVIIAAKTATAHPKLPGTIYTAAVEIEKAGGKCLPCIVDVRDEASVDACVEEGVKKFGGIDILVNNASAISLTGTVETPMKRFDLMHQINTRGTYMMFVTYTMAKYGMSMCVLGMAEELKGKNIGVNALWPRTAIITAAMEMLGGKEVASQCRKPEIMSDAAYAILCRDPRHYTGNFAIDDEVLAEHGISNFDQYAVVPGAQLMPDFFLEEAGSPEELAQSMKERGATPKFDVGSSSSNASSGTVDHVFVTLKAMLSEDLVKSTQASYAFDVTDGGKWHLDLKEGSGSAGKDFPSSPDVTFVMNTECFVDMFTGKVKPTGAFMAGKMKIKGDMMKAMKLEKMMGQMKGKI